MSCEEAFVERLRERGFRLTPQREMILAVMHQVEGLVTTEDIHARVQKLSSCVDLSTVYRTLNLFQEFGLVTPVDVGDGQRRYEFVGVEKPHLHLVCETCGRVSVADLDAARPLVDLLKERYGFEAQLDRLSVPGTCAGCSAERLQSTGDRG
jgi:Fur family ferric uptake transcriptional regulator